jgi:hypothetical protein
LITPGGGSTSLGLNIEPADTKATNAVASFDSSVSGRARLSCAGVFDTYIDNATSDPSGWALVGATIMLTIGAPLLLSVGYARWQARTPARPQSYPIIVRRT